MKNITLVIPAKKEAESLPLVLDELKKFDYEISIVLDRNDFETINAIKKYNCNIVYQSGSGYGNAIIEGINSTATEYFCIYNADGSFRPEEISKMFSLIQQNKSDFIFGTRYEKDCGSDDDDIVTSIGNFGFTLLGKIFFRLKLTDILYTFVLGKTKSAQSLRLKQNDFTFCVELPIKAKKNNMIMETSKSYERSRIAGIKKVNVLKDGFLILKHMFILFFKK